MTLDALVAEIRSRSLSEIARLREQRAADEARIVAEQTERVGAIRSEQDRLARAEAARVRAQLLAAAKVNARKRVFEARERRMQGLLRQSRSALSEFTDSAEYDATLRRMIAAATQTLGKQARISGRPEDADRLAEAAGKGFDPTPRSILGGIVAESPDGSRRLNLSLDELLRLREPAVRELFA